LLEMCETKETSREGGGGGASPVTSNFGWLGGTQRTWKRKKEAGCSRVKLAAVAQERQREERKKNMSQT